MYSNNNNNNNMCKRNCLLADSLDEKITDVTIKDFLKSAVKLMVFTI